MADERGGGAEFVSSNLQIDIAEQWATVWGAAGGLLSRTTSEVPHVVSASAKRTSSVRKDDAGERRLPPRHPRGGQGSATGLLRQTSTPSPSSPHLLRLRRRTCRGGRGDVPRVDCADGAGETAVTMRDETAARFAETRPHNTEAQPDVRAQPVEGDSGPTRSAFHASCRIA